MQFRSFPESLLWYAFFLKSFLHFDEFRKISGQIHPHTYSIIALNCRIQLEKHQALYTFQCCVRNNNLVLHALNCEFVSPRRDWFGWLMNYIIPRRIEKKRDVRQTKYKASARSNKHFSLGPIYYSIFVYCGFHISSLCSMRTMNPWDIGVLNFSKTSETSSSLKKSVMPLPQFNTCYFYDSRTFHWDIPIVFSCSV